MKSLYTERLILRPFRTSDALFLLELLNSEGWLKFIGDRGVRTIQDAGKYLAERIIPSYAINGFGMLSVDLQNGTSIGMCGLVKRPGLEHPDLGFAILPLYEQKGFMMEASLAVLREAKNIVPQQVLLAITTDDNLYSKKLLSKLGFLYKEKIKLNEDEAELMLFEMKL